jgi:hypothetical protein
MDSVTQYEPFKRTHELTLTFLVERKGLTPPPLLVKNPGSDSAGRQDESKSLEWLNGNHHGVCIWEVEDV